jgi:hypothetical protein
MADGKQKYLNFLYEDFWGRMVFETVASGTRCVDVDGELHSITDEGEPAFPINRKTADFYPHPIN